MSGPIWAEGLHVIEGNEIDLIDDESESAGIFVNSATGWVIKGNTSRNSKSPTGAIDVGDTAGPGAVVDNVVERSRVGILSSSFSLVEIEGNHVTDGETGIRGLRGSLELAGNTVEGVSGNAIMIGGTAVLSGTIASGGSATLSGNSACGNSTDLWIGADAEVVVDDSNEFCVIEDPREG